MQRKFAATQINHFQNNRGSAISEHWNCSRLSPKQGTLQTSDLVKDTKLTLKIQFFSPKKITELRLGYPAQDSFNTYLFTNFPLCITIP